MTSPVDKFRVGDKVTVHDPLIDKGVVTRVGRKYVTVTPGLLTWGRVWRALQLL
ncbi:MAG: hypothetical protein QOD02_3033 [Mycobacterium sp.]|jgi:hypothetical protein|nr:hypothetical protein [Mycobacterium sp.]